MRSWVDLDADGRQFLAREGSGWVMAVVPTDPSLEAFRVEILCRLPEHWSAALRTTVTAVIPAGHPLMAEVHAHEASGAEVAWSMQWHRHDDVPAEIPVTSLDLAHDTASRLHELRPVAVVESTLEATSDG